MLAYEAVDGFGTRDAHTKKYHCGKIKAASLADSQSSSESNLGSVGLRWRLREHSPFQGNLQTHSEITGHVTGHWARLDV